MAFSHSWIAVQGPDLETLTGTLGLAPFGHERLAHDVPDLAAAELPDRWVVIVDADPAAAFRKPFAGLTAHGPAIACSENATRAEVRGYDDGDETWRIICDFDAEDILSYAGEPPDEWGALLDMTGEAAFDAQEEEAADAFREAVLNFALVMCGFRLSAPPEGLGWTELRPRGPR